MNACKKDSATNTNNTTKNTNTTDSTSIVDSALVIVGEFADPDIIKVSDSVWRLYYAIKPEVPNNNFEVFTSWSKDGVNWNDEDTILTMATFPDIIKTKEGKYRIYFQRAQLINSAISDDGINFTDESGTRVKPPIDTASAAATSTILLPDDTYLMVYRETVNGKYESNSINSVTTAFRTATSTDGLNFTLGDIIVEGRCSTFDGYIDGGELFFMNDTLHLRFWTSAGFQNQEDAGHYDMYSLDNGKTWSAYILFDDSFIGGDPTFAKIGNDWLMYHTGYDGGIYYKALN